MTWRSIHVYYYDDELDDLVVDAVWPMFRQVGDAVSRAYFIRHWKRGQHLRLNVEAPPVIFDGVVRPAAEAQVGAYLAAKPATATIDPASLLPLHQWLAAAEREGGDLMPWHANNSLLYADHDLRLDVVGSADAAALILDFYCATNELAFQTTSLIRDGGSRLGAAFDLMIATAHALSGKGITYGFISFRSHAEAFLANSPNGEQIRARWDQTYAEHAKRLVQRAAAVVASLEGGDASVPFVRSWVDRMSPIRDYGQQLLADGRMSLDPTPAADDTRPHLTTVSMKDLSPFHRRLDAGTYWREHVKFAPWFGAYRLSLNCTYLQLTRLGVTPAARFRLCYLAARAVEDCYGCSVMDVIGAG